MARIKRKEVTGGLRWKVSPSGKLRIERIKPWSAKDKKFFVELKKWMKDG